MHCRHITRTERLIIAKALRAYAAAAQASENYFVRKHAAVASVLAKVVTRSDEIQCYVEEEPS